MPSSSESATTTRESFTDEEKVAIKEQLERLLANPFFSHSRRFPQFLHYIVKASMKGEADLLKERTLGIDIFGKNADYDTASDPIVRVTAAEIRRRIAQYYQDPGHENELRISLPLGSYIPRFHFQATEPVANEVELAAEVKASAAPVAPSPAPNNKRRWILAVVCCVLMAGAVISVLAWRQAQRSAFAEFWGPMLSSTEPVLFCVADQTQYTVLTLRDAQDPARQVTLKDNLTAVIITDLSPVIKIAGVLQSEGKPYKLRGENATTLEDLRNGPSVMIGAFDNAWTLRMLRPLRYHFANNPGMTIFSIIDTSAQGHAPWVVDRGQQIATNNYVDYAIVARFTDETTGKPTLVAAGIGRGGTIAAGEFLTNPELLKAVWDRRTTPNARNIEVVLGTQIIDGEPGTPKIEAVYTW